MIDYPAFDGTQACSGAGGEAARGFNGAAGADPAPALALCRTCTFQAVCAQYALTHDTHGVWGGLTETDRDTLREERQLAVPLAVTDHLDALVCAIRGAALARS